MIVQTAPPGEAHFVIMQTDHTVTSGQLASAFGNAQFERSPLHDLLTYVAAHHDEGWRAVDAQQTLDDRTGLPYHLTQTPTAQLLATGSASPDFNEAFHPFCGILSSMHTYGLYHGRYGLSDKIYIDSIDGRLRPQAEAMLNHELERQKRLKADLSRTSETAEWAAENFLFYHYKLLQFFDTLSLYVQMTHFDAIAPTAFLHVPRTPTQDITLQARPVAPYTISLSPYPFEQDGLEVFTEGRYLLPFADPTADWRADYDAQPLTRQTVRFVSEGHIR